MVSKKSVLLDPGTLLVSLLAPNGYSYLCLHNPHIDYTFFINASSLCTVIRILTENYPEEYSLQRKLFMQLWPNTHLLSDPSEQDLRRLKVAVPYWLKSLLVCAINARCEFLFTLDTTLLNRTVKSFAKRYGLCIIQPNQHLLRQLG